MKPRAHNIAAATAQVAVAAEVPPAPAVVDTTVQPLATEPTTPAPAATPELDATEVAAFHHPAVVKYIAELEAWAAEEIAKAKAEANALIAHINIFKSGASPNDIHANNSIEAVNAASPAK